MAQLSRPYQIGLLVVAVFGAVFLLAFHGKSTPTLTTSAPAPSAPAAKSSQAAPHGAGQTGSAAEQAELSKQVYHGSAPGVGGLTHAIAQAHGAAVTSEKTNAQLAQKSAEASSVNTPAATTGAATGAAAGTGAAAATSVSHSAAGTTVRHSSVVASPTKTTSVHVVVHTKTPSTAAKPATGASASAPAGQRAVEAELKQGKTVLLLFWNPRGTDDRLVHKELRLMIALHSRPAIAKLEAIRHDDGFFGPNFNKEIAVHETLGASVAAYGSITRGVQVYGTPTLLILNSKAETITLTGVVDAFGIEQAIAEARSS